MINLGVDYFLLVVIAALGALQITAASSGLRGLWIIPQRRAVYLIGALLLVGAFAWFVLTGDTNIPGDLGGVEGSEQFGLFLGGVAVAALLTAGIASLTQRKAGAPPAGVEGIEALRHTTLAGLLRARSMKRGGNG
ncbi:MAG: hypothetical protein FJ039_08210 [Chloroflexi bacterium]|nr:hypothetical protein [Chloroflexota bacterium]